jgi:CheY-like chemotaxis protein
MYSEKTPFDASQEPDPSVRWRAWRMWLAAGRPHGREDEYLQRARELQAADDSPAARPLPNAVHIVDDDEAVRDSLQSMLEASGYRTRTWSSGIDLLRGLPGLEPGCIIADVRMPEMDGLTLLGQLRAKNVKLPVIVITGHGDVPIAVQAMKAGAADFIEKPFARELILESIRMALRQTSPISRMPAR